MTKKIETISMILMILLIIGIVFMVADMHEDLSKDFEKQFEEDIGCPIDEASNLRLILKGNACVNGGSQN